VGGQAAKKEGERQGDFLGGKYLLEDCLGIGGMGEVYRATNVSLGRKVAIKLLNKEHTSNEDDVMRFLREARAAAAIRHPNVVDVFDVARDDDGTPFIVQELLAGQDLEQYLGASDGRLPSDEALEIMIPVADAVAAAHRQDVVHRDLKPANIFLAREGNKIIPKVLDFGACLYQTVGALSAKEQRMLIGTPHYMAPEQITTAMDVDARADVWAMGVILYELLVGETPFEAEDANTVLKAVRTRNVKPLRKVAPLASQQLEELVARCLDRDRKKRFADAGVVRAELDRIRKELRPARRKRVDTDTEPEFEPEPAKVVEQSTIERRGDRKVADARVDPRKEEEAAPPSSHRVPSLVLKGAKTPTKRRGSSLLTLSSPDDAVGWDDGLALDGAPGPQSASRPIEASKPVRTAADVFRDVDAAPKSSSSSGWTSGAWSPTLPQSSASPPVSPRLPPPPPSRPAEAGAPRDLDLDETDDPLLDLDFAPPSRRASTAGQSSIPPVLDPRAAGPRSSRGDRPPVSKSSGELAADVPRSSLSTTKDPSLVTALTPPLAPPRSPRASSASLAALSPPQPWTTRARSTFAAAIVVPALVAFIVLHFVPSVMAPLGHAMRGDSPLASGVLAVLTLVGAAALAARALGSSRSTGMLVATVGAVLLGIVMIIVTFSASETAELEIPPAAGGIVPFIAPLIPLGLGLGAFARARSAWLSVYERSDAIKFAIVTSLMLFALLELGPAGAVRAATTRTGSSAPAAAPAAPPRPAP
jgi:serine/threonine-protein kinase